VVHQSGGAISTALDRLSAARYTAVQLDGTLAGIRPRELDQRARKDLAALLTRRGLRLGGIDLFIPRRHYLDSIHQDRAVHATLAAIELAADLGRVPLSITLPITDINPDVMDCLIDAAEGRSVSLAIHAEDELEPLLALLDQIDLRTVAAALDPAAILAQSLDPSTIVSKVGSHLAAVRLSDQLSSSDANLGASGMRCPVGTGELDIVAYKIAIDLATSRTGPIILDLRGLPNPLSDASTATKAWDDASISM